MGRVYLRRLPTRRAFEDEVNAKYVIRPKADEDLDDQAFYLAEKAGPGRVIDFWSLHTKRSHGLPAQPTWDGTLA
jgi:hypothetical protein